MADDKDHYQHDPFYYYNQQSSFPLFSRDQNESKVPSKNLHQARTSFTDCLHGNSMDHYNTLSRAFDLSNCSSSEVISSIDDNPKKPTVGDSANSSVSSSSNEAEAVTEEDSAKTNKDKQQKVGCDDDGDEKSKKE